MKELKVGQKVTYTKIINFGEKVTETAKVVAIFMGMALLDNGDEIFAIQ